MYVCRSFRKIQGVYNEQGWHDDDDGDSEANPISQMHFHINRKCIWSICFSFSLYLIKIVKRSGRCISGLYFRSHTTQHIIYYYFFHSLPHYVGRQASRQAVRRGWLWVGGICRVVVERVAEMVFMGWVGRSGWNTRGGFGTGCVAQWPLCSLLYNNY